MDAGGEGDDDYLREHDEEDHLQSPLHGARVHGHGGRVKSPGERGARGNGSKRNGSRRRTMDKMDSKRRAQTSIASLKRQSRRGSVHDPASTSIDPITDRITDAVEVLCNSLKHFSCPHATPPAAATESAAGVPPSSSSASSSTSPEEARRKWLNTPALFGPIKAEAGAAIVAKELSR